MESRLRYDPKARSAASAHIARAQPRRAARLSAIVVACALSGWATVTAEERPEVARLVVIACDGQLEPLFRATAVWQLATYPEDLARNALIAAASDDHPAVRLVAVAMLGESPHFRDDPATRHGAALVLLGALDDRERAVRITALLALVNLGGWDYEPATNLKIDRVSHELQEWAALNEDDAGLQRSMGLVYLLTGESGLAARALEMSLQIDVEGQGTRYLLGLARLTQRRLADARALFKQVPSSDRYFQHAQEQLKMIP